MMTIGPLAIIDTVCPRPYSLASLAAGALGGTEATVVRIAEALDAQVFQQGREAADGRYRPLGALTDPGAMIVLRDPKAAMHWAGRFPGIPLFVWMHDLIVDGKDRATRLRACAGALATANATMVAVSDFHRDQIADVLATTADGARVAHAVPKVVRIYNPIAAGLEPGPADAVDRDKLIFFSNAAKGLDFAIFVFRGLRRRWPALRLVVANPGYATVATRRVDGVVDLGALSQRNVLAEVATSLCTFCPNFEFPETFGLVLAESNAVGTPVLAHPLGAAAEVLDDPRQMIDLPAFASLAYRATKRLGRGHGAAARIVDWTAGFEPFADRIDAWRSGGRPDVRARPQFGMDEIVRDWRSLLSGQALL